MSRFTQLGAVANHTDFARVHTQTRGTRGIGSWLTMDLGTFFVTLLSRGTSATTRVSVERSSKPDSFQSKLRNSLTRTHTHTMRHDSGVLCEHYEY